MYLNFSFDIAIFNVLAVAFDYPINLMHVPDVNVHMPLAIINHSKLEKKEVDVGRIVLFFVRVEAFSCFCSELAFLNHLL
jgi:hypothetical protein